MKATEQYFPVVLFIMLYKVLLTFDSVDEILKCDHSNESYWAELSCGAVYHAVQGGFWFSSVRESEILTWECCHSNESYTEHYFPVQSVDYVVQGGAELSFGTVCYAVQWRWF